MEIERRTVLQVGGLVAVGGLVVACGSGESGSAAASPSSAPASGGSAAGSTAPSGAAGAVASVSDIPVGGGIILADEGVVVTQPNEGEIKAFSAICTHQGCLVSEVSDNQIVCPCHQSIFSAVDGSVIQGPATEPLPAAGVTVDGGSVVLG